MLEMYIASSTDILETMVIGVFAPITDPQWTSENTKLAIDDLVIVKEDNLSPLK